jgi:glycosyltransferase involved in cell wall biosynthesis
VSESLTVVLPAYNEEESIGLAVERAVDALPPLVEEWEIIVVDDGSSDGTADRVRPFIAEHPSQVRLVRHRRNLGYGAAIRTGFRRASGDLVFYTDSDNQFDIAELEYFLPLIRSHDVVVGFRVYRYDPVFRSLLSWFYNRLVRVLFRVRVRDVDCAFKLFRAEVIRRTPIESTDFFVDTELLARARKWNFQIVEKGVRHYPRMAGRTTVQASDISRTLRTVARMWQLIYFPTRAQLDAVARQDEQIELDSYEVLPAPTH